MNRIIKPTFFVLVCFIFLQVSSAISHAQSNEDFIQGQWKTGGTLPASGPDSHPMSWQMTWKITPGKLVREGYPPYYEEAEYKVLKSDNNSITLQVIHKKGNGSTDGQETVSLKLDRAGDSFTVGDQTFKRVKP